jgi:GT2 family glycosyltransferase
LLKPGLTLLILTYKGKHHLEHLLPTVKIAVEQYNSVESVDVLIIDNGKDTLTRDFVTGNYPAYQYIGAENNYLFSINDSVAQLTTEFVFILNDDIRLDADILNQLVPFIAADKSMFAVTCKFRDWDNTYTASAVRNAKYDKGWLHHYYEDHSEDTAKYTLYPSGGGSVFRTAMFNEIGGFDKLYWPGYCEDTDLGIQAWQNGWTDVYYPQAFLYHREGGTMNDYFKQNKLDRMIYKNYILWNVKNTRYSGFLFWFFILYPFRMMTTFITRRNHFKAFIDAIPSLGMALQQRSKRKPIVKDENWLPLLNTVYIKSVKD